MEGHGGTWTHGGTRGDMGTCGEWGDTGGHGGAPELGPWGHRQHQEGHGDTGGHGGHRGPRGRSGGPWGHGGAMGTPGGQCRSTRTRAMGTLGDMGGHQDQGHGDIGGINSSMGTLGDMWGHWDQSHGDTGMIRRAMGTWEGLGDTRGTRAMGTIRAHGGGYRDRGHGDTQGKGHGGHWGLCTHGDGTPRVRPKGAGPVKGGGGFLGEVGGALLKWVGQRWVGLQHSLPHQGRAGVGGADPRGVSHHPSGRGTGRGSPWAARGRTGASRRGRGPAGGTRWEQVGTPQNTQVKTPQLLKSPQNPSNT